MWLSLYKTLDSAENTLSGQCWWACTWSKSIECASSVLSAALVSGKPAGASRLNVIVVFLRCLCLFSSLCFWVNGLRKPKHPVLSFPIYSFFLFSLPLQYSDVRFAMFYFSGCAAYTNKGLHQQCTHTYFLGFHQKWFTFIMQLYFLNFWLFSTKDICSVIHSKTLLNIK